MSGSPYPGTPTSELTSASLLERIKSQGPDAWRHFVHLYGPLVFHWCTRLGIRHDDAADVGQDVFRAVAKGIGGFRHGRPGDTFWRTTIDH